MVSTACIDALKYRSYCMVTYNVVFNNVSFSSLDINLKYIQEYGFDSPFLFESSEGLGMRYQFNFEQVIGLFNI